MKYLKLIELLLQLLIRLIPLANNNTANRQNTYTNKGSAEKMNTFWKILAALAAVASAFLIAKTIIERTAKVSENEKRRLTILRTRLNNAARRSSDASIEGAEDFIADYRDDDDDDDFVSFAESVSDAAEDIADDIADAAEDFAELTEDSLDQLLDD